MYRSNDLQLKCLHLSVTPRQLAKLDHNVRATIWISAILRLDQEECEVKLAYRGSHTRGFPKKSFQIKFVSPEIYRGEREIHLNAEYADPSLIRNKLSFDFFSRIGALSPQANHILLYINGDLAGIYLMIESVDRNFLQKRNLSEGPIYYAINSNANFSLVHPKTSTVKDSLESGYQRKHGTADDDAYLRTLIFKINTTPIAQFEAEIEKHLDVNQYLRWLAGAVCTQNFDGFIHNYALYRDSIKGRFFIIPWDYDATWGRNVNGNELNHTALPLEGYNTLSARLLDTPSFRLSYRTLLQSIFRDHYTVMEIEPEINKLQQLIAAFVHLDPHRRHSIDVFEAERAFILSFIEKRRTFLMEGLALF
ncbi:CotH kinase family protein [Paenibacillus sp. NPDC057967]|uniref:CotH kinase family protein n=1 Tax=Paenibacillus sp. NPDC057967 TaxID=3346293 RepID=UPI0036DB6CBE